MLMVMAVFGVVVFLAGTAFLFASEPVAEKIAPAGGGIVAKVEALGTAMLLFGTMMIGLGI